MTKDLEELKRYTARLEFELSRVRETVENQFSRIEVLERHIYNSALALPHSSLDLSNAESGKAGFLKNRETALHFFLDHPTTGPLVGTPGLGCYALKGKTKLTLGFAVFDQSVEALQHIVGRIVDNQRRTRGFTPVFLTNNPDFTPFRAQKYLYEYFRTDSDMVTSLKDKHHCQFLQERFQFMLKKWDISMVVDLSADLTYPQASVQ